MIHRWSESIAGRLASAGIIQDKKAVYAYGLELLFSSLFSTGAIILISMLARRPFHWLFFSAGFIPLRLTAGGYHASSHMKCVLTTAAAFSVSLFGANVIGNRLSMQRMDQFPFLEHGRPKGKRVKDNTQFELGGSKTRDSGNLSLDT